MDRYDCIVVGAGPAGATAARRLALNGLKTLIIEKEPLPRYKPCGGATTPAIMQLLDFDNSGVVERVIKGVTFFSRDDKEQSVFHPDGMRVSMVSRSAFDQSLVEAALQGGAALMEKTRVTSIEESDKQITVRTDSGDILTCLVVIGADGAGSVAAKSAGLYRGPGGIGIEAELYPRDPDAIERCSDMVFFGFGFIPKGYGWVFPKKDHFSVGIATTLGHLPSLPSLYHQFIDRFDFLRETSQELRRGWFIPFSKGPGLLNTRRVCLTGDAARLADPFSGEGIYYAVLSAVIAAGIISGELEQYGNLSKKYTKEINRRIVKDFTYAQWCADIFFLSPQFFYRRERVIRALTRLSNKEIMYRGVFNELRKGIAAHKGHIPFPFKLEK